MTRVRATCFAVVSLLLACGTVTEVPDVWRDQDFGGGPFANIFVIGVSENPDTRRLFENRFAEELAKRGGGGGASYESLPDVGHLSESRVREAVANGKYDGVLVTHLISRGEESSYVEPRPYAVPRVNPGYYNDYTATWEVIQQPGYTTSNDVARLETRLYDLRSGKRVWSAKSQTLDPRSLAAGIVSVTAAVAKQLAADGMIR